MVFIPVNYDGKIYKYIFVIITYLCVVVFIRSEQDNLNIYHLDMISLLIIVFIGFFRSRFSFQGEVFFQLPIYFLTLYLVILIFKLRKKIPKTSFIWILIGSSFCVMIIPLAYIESLQPGVYSATQSQYGVFFDGIKSFLYNLSFIAPFEEITFRGLLWGQMHKLGWSEKTIFWSQAGIFWFLHIWRIGTPISLVITIPITTIMFSILVRYSRQLSPSILFHAISNALIPIVAQLIITSRLH